MKTPETKHIHHNHPQLIVNLVQTQIMVCLWGRATGKTEGPIADFIYENVRLMPRSLGAIISVTYEKMLRFIIPKLVKAWERYGYIENVHYWIRKKAPANLKIDMPYLPVADPKHFIHHWNGAGNTLISMDRKGIGNAGDLDYISGDEMRFVKKENLDEVLNANRGNIEHFGHLSQHHSVLLTSDMPQDMKGRWLLDFAQLVDPDVINGILMIQQKLFQLREELEKKRSEASKKKVQRLIDKYLADLNMLRKEEVFVSEASTFDNVHALGLNFLKNLKRTLKASIWQLSVLNEKIANAENGFYPMFDVDQHGYTATNISKLDNLELDFQRQIEKDHTWDRDCQNNLPLHIGLDHNKAITWIVIFQHKRNSKKRDRIELQNSMYVKDPKRIRHVIKDFTDYYKTRSNRTIYYWFDHNSVAEDSMKEHSFADEVVKRLRQEDFNVVRRYIGRAPSHKAKYDLTHELMEGKNPSLPEFWINTNNNETLISAIKQTDAKMGKEGFEKNKDAEKDASFPQEEAPHGTDAMDIPIFGILASKIRMITPSGGAMTD